MSQRTRTQYPLIEEYTLHHKIKAPIIYNFKVYIPYLRGIGLSGTCLGFRVFRVQGVRVRSHRV